MAKKKGEITEAVGAAIAAGVAGPAITAGGRISYAPRLAETSAVNLSAETRSNSIASMSLLVNGTPIEVQRVHLKPQSATFEIDGRSFSVELVQSIPETAKMGHARSSATISRGAGASGEILSPLPGIVSELLCKKGDTVAAGQLLLRIEAMKMQNNVYANIDGKVDSVEVGAGDEVAAGQRMLTIKG
jgi:biotin carboxyl carrier protein